MVGSWSGRSVAEPHTSWTTEAEPDPSYRHTHDRLGNVCTPAAPPHLDHDPHGLWIHSDGSRRRAIWFIPGTIAHRGRAVPPPTPPCILSRCAYNPSLPCLGAATPGLCPHWADASHMNTLRPMTSPSRVATNNQRILVERG